MGSESSKIGWLAPFYRSSSKRRSALLVPRSSWWARPSYAWPCGGEPMFDGDDLDAREPAFISRVLPMFRWYAQHYVRLAPSGLEHLGNEPALLVANHNGGICGPDLPAPLATLWGCLGPEAPLYALAHDFAMRQLTPLGRVLQKFGALRASPENARRALSRGAQVLVYPGGDIEAYRHFSRRDAIVLGRRRGYVRLARELGVPIQPIVVQGAH